MVTCSMKKMKWLTSKDNALFHFFCTNRYRTKVTLEFFLVQNNNRRSLYILDKDLIRWLSEANFRTMGILSL